MDNLRKKPHERNRNVLLQSLSRIEAQECLGTAGTPCGHRTSLAGPQLEGPLHPCLGKPHRLNGSTAGASGLRPPSGGCSASSVTGPRRPCRSRGPVPRGRPAPPGSQQGDSMPPLSACKWWCSRHCLSVLQFVSASTLHLLISLFQEQNWNHHSAWPAPWASLPRRTWCLTALQSSSETPSLRPQNPSPFDAGLEGHTGPSAPATLRGEGGPRARRELCPS